MIIDYVRYSRSNEFPIPAFHTGHLGLFQGNEVSMSLIRSDDRDEASCELAVTPFSEQLENLCRVRVRMRDGVGAIRRLLEAVADIGLNVVTLETTVADCKRFHHVVLVADWKPSPHNNYRETPRHVRHLYRRLAYRVPIHDWRYVLMYESIMHSCGDIIEMDIPNRSLSVRISEEEMAERRAAWTPPAAACW